MKEYLGYSTNEEIRYKATSGGVGTSIIKYLFDYGLIDYSVSFKFDNRTLSYIPELISSYSEYTICGSIYQEMDYIGYIKSTLSEIKVGSSIALFCLPCQAKLIRTLCQKSNIKVFLIGLTCSSQQSIDATLYLLQRMNIDKKNISHIQYRGEGWPSGIRIQLRNGTIKYLPNNRSLWADIFHSKLFIQKRCFGCNNTLNDFCDISLADPWLEEIKHKEKVGQTLFSCRTQEGEDIINNMIKVKAIVCNELSEGTLLLSQKGTIKLKQSYRNHTKTRNWMMHIILSESYRKFATTKLGFRIHIFLKNLIENIIK